MDSTLKNATVILLVLTCAFVGYYVFIQNDNSELDPSNGALSQELFADVQKYIERSSVLSRVKLDTTIFSNERFQSLTSYATEEVTVKVGRTNPFDEAENSPVQ